MKVQQTLAIDSSAFFLTKDTYQKNILFMEIGLKKMNRKKRKREYRHGFSANRYSAFAVKTLHTCEGFSFYKC